MIACNCDYGCPCNVNGLPTTGKCEGGWTWHVDSGRFGETALDGLNFSIYIGSVAELRVEPITNPVTGAEVHPRLMLPEGLLTRDLGLFRSQQFRVEGGPVSYDHSGRYVGVGDFSYTEP